jgi:hypothetical protein
MGHPADLGFQARAEIAFIYGTVEQAAEKVLRGMEMMPSAAKAGPVCNYLRTG